MKNFTTIVTNFVVFFVLGFLVYESYKINQLITLDRNVIVEIVNKKDNSIDNTIRQDLIILENKLNYISDLNDKRFEMLGWGVGVIVTVIALFLIVNFVNSKSTIRDMVHEELNEKHNEFNTQLNELLKDMKTKREQINSEIEKMNS